MGLTSEQKQAWEKDGYFVVRGLFPSNSVEIIRERISAIAEDYYARHQRGEKLPNQFLIEPDVLAGKVTPPAALDAIRKIGHVTAYDGTLQEVFGRNPASVEILRDMLGGNIVAVMGALFAKPPGHGSATPWHQDQGLWGYQLPNAVSIWAPLGPCTRENGCLQFWRGSHRNGTAEHVFPEGAIHKHLPEDAVNREEMEYIEMDAGDAVFFGGNVWHMSETNRSGVRRLGVVVVYADHDEFQRGLTEANINYRSKIYWIVKNGQKEASNECS